MGTIDRWRWEVSKEVLRGCCVCAVEIWIRLILEGYGSDDGSPGRRSWKERRRVGKDNVVPNQSVTFSTCERWKLLV